MTLNRLVQARQDRHILEPRDIAASILEDIGDDVNAMCGLLAEILPGCIATAQARFRLTQPRAPNMFSGMAQREAYSKLYGQVVPLPSGRKLLGDCVKTELLEYALTLRAHVKATERKSDRYERIASLLPDDTTTVKQASIGLAA